LVRRPTTTTGKLGLDRKIEASNATPYPPPARDMAEDDTRSTEAGDSGWKDRTGSLVKNIYLPE